MKKTIAIRNNTIYIHATKDKIRYRFSTKLPHTKENYKYVLDNYEAILEDYINPKPNITEDSFAFYAKKFLKTKSYLKEQSKNNLKTITTLLCNYFGDIKITHIKKDNITEFYEFLYAKRYKRESARNIIIVLQGILNTALDDEVILKNPFYRHSLKNMPRISERMPFSFEEARLLLQKAKQTNTEMYYYLTLAFWSGMRVGEILALEWDDLDFENKKININKSQQKNGVITTTKNENSIRSIDMLSPIYKEFKQWKEMLNIDKGGVIFTLPHTYFIRNFKKIQKQCDLDSTRVLYTTRHSFASIMLQKGEEQLWISKMLGHKNLNITLSTYAKFITQKDAKRATFLDDTENQAEENNIDELGKKNSDDRIKTSQLEIATQEA